MPDSVTSCEPNPRRYSEEESRMRGVEFCEDIILLPIPYIPPSEECVERSEGGDFVPEVRIEEQEISIVRTTHVFRDVIVNNLNDVLRDVTATIRVTATVTSTVTNTVTLTPTSVIPCESCPPCTPHDTVPSMILNIGNCNGGINEIRKYMRIPSNSLCNDIVNLSNNGTMVRFYNDLGRTIPFNGNNQFYTFLCGGTRYIMKIDESGYIIMNGALRPSIDIRQCNAVP